MQDLYTLIKFQNGITPRNKGENVLTTEVMAESPTTVNNLELIFEGESSNGWFT